MAARTNIEDFIFEFSETKPTNIEKYTLHMCFKEWMHDKSVALVILVISLSNLLNHAEVEDGKSPSLVAYKELGRECDALGCSVSDFQVFFVGGVRGNKMHFFDPSAPSLNIGTIRCIPRSTKIEPFILEMNDDRRLYVLSRVPTTDPNFEVLNPEQMRWDVLSEPPYDRIGLYFCPTTDAINIFLLGQKPDSYICNIPLIKTNGKRTPTPIFFLSPLDHQL